MCDAAGDVTERKKKTIPFKKKKKKKKKKKCPPPARARSCATRCPAPAARPRHRCTRSTRTSTVTWRANSRSRPRAAGNGTSGVERRVRNLARRAPAQARGRPGRTSPSELPKGVVMLEVTTTSPAEAGGDPAPLDRRSAPSSGRPGRAGRTALAPDLFEAVSRAAERHGATRLPQTWDRGRPETSSVSPRGGMSCSRAAGGPRVPAAARPRLRRALPPRGSTQSGDLYRVNKMMNEEMTITINVLACCKPSTVNRYRSYRHHV